MVDKAASALWISHYPPGIDSGAPLRIRALPEILAETVGSYGNRPALDFLGKRSTWAEIGVAVDRFAAALQKLGAGKGMKIGLCLPNGYHFLVSYYAVLKTGATVVNFNPLYAVRELSHQIEDSDTDIMITVDLKIVYDKIHQVMRETRLNTVIVCRFADQLPFAKNILFNLFKRRDIARIEYSERCLCYRNLMAVAAAVPEPVAIDPYKDLAVLQYTGGTTGVPKGAMLTHANVSANVEQSVAWFPDARPGQDKMLGVLPFFHVFAMTAVMNFAVRQGFEIIALPRFDLEQALKTIVRRRPEFFPAVPAIFNAINNRPDLDKYDLSSLRFCISGGAPLPVEVKKTFERKTGCVVVEGYGLSESSPVASVNPVAGDNRPGSIGLPLPHTVMEIVSLDDRTTLMPPGERGEICIRGPQVMAGYWKKPEDTAVVLKAGRLHTGDVGIMDADGYFYIVDRIKDMIITNGYNVYPRNVEEMIYLHPAVEECIVAGVPDPDRGEAVKSWIKTRADHNLAPDDLKEFLRDKLSPMEIPRHYEIGTEPLPKTMVGKLSRKDVLAREKSS